MYDTSQQTLLDALKRSLSSEALLLIYELFQYTLPVGPSVRLPVRLLAMTTNLFAQKLGRLELLAVIFFSVLLWRTTSMNGFVLFKLCSKS